MNYRCQWHIHKIHNGVKDFIYEWSTNFCGQIVVYPIKDVRQMVICPHCARQLSLYPATIALLDYYE